MEGHIEFAKVYFSKYPCLIQTIAGEKEFRAYGSATKPIRAADSEANWQTLSVDINFQVAKWNSFLAVVKILKKVNPTGMWQRSLLKYSKRMMQHMSLAYVHAELTPLACGRQGCSQLLNLNVGLPSRLLFKPSTIKF
ncbi:hypothetical protein C5167_008737 [Papaver somniferum]|uniref:Uncharacterized protein n=1 Tax=Papaver somniferum TaxID=3469 RepID=A0A4Y7JWH8_PAPSO|nr:hypothetical protein C5167_008737 [Papaver somniferum]